VVRNGYHQPRKVTTAAGTVEVKAPARQRQAHRRRQPASANWGGSGAAALAMVFKLVESAQARWRAVNAPHLVALVQAGARFERGHLVERPEAPAA
jgi:hypothetical protein